MVVKCIVEQKVCDFDSKGAPQVHLTKTIKVLFSNYILFSYCLLERPFGPLLAPPEGLRAPGLPGVNPRGRPQESGGDSKVI